MWINTWADSEGESLSCALLAVWITYMGHFFQVSFGQLLALPDSETVFGVPHDPPICECTYLSWDGFQWRSLWVGWHHLLPFYLQGTFLCMCSQECFLDLRMKNMWSFISYLPGQKPASSTILLLWTFCLSTEGKLFSLGSTYLLPQGQTNWNVRI